MTRAEYVAVDAANFSTLRHFRRSPAHARHVQLNGQEESASMRLGTLLHCYLLEPDRFLSRYVEVPASLCEGITTKAGKPAAAPKQTDEYKARLARFGQENIGKLFLEDGELDACRSVGESIAAHSVAADLLAAPGQCEVAVIWRCPDTGELCKGLVDKILTYQGQRIIIDLKTCDDASKPGFRKSMRKYGYPMQVAWYLLGLHHLGQNARRFLHVLCETEPPYAVAVREINDATVDRGLERIADYLRQYKQCRDRDYWPGYADVIEEDGIPASWDDEL